MRKGGRCSVVFEKLRPPVWSKRPEAAALQTSWEVAQGIRWNECRVRIVPARMPRPKFRAGANTRGPSAVARPSSNLLVSLPMGDKGVS